MKNIFKVIILLMIVFVIFAGCSIPQGSKSSGSSNSKKSQSNESKNNIPFDIGDVNAYRSITEEECGIDSTGYFYTIWLDKQKGTPYGTMAMLIDFDFFSAGWTDVHGVLMGKGWETGDKNRILNMSCYGDLGPRGFFGVYGWAEHDYSASDPDSLIEYYIVHRWTGGNGYGANHDENGNEIPAEHPNGSLGYFTSRNGGVYDIYRTYRWHKPSIKAEEDSNFVQYWSVLRNGNSNNMPPFNTGNLFITTTKVYVKDHIDAWEAAGWNTLKKMDTPMGTLDNGKKYPGTYQAMIVEGAYEYDYGSGYAWGGVTGTLEIAKQMQTKKGIQTQWSGKLLTVVDQSDYSDIMCKNENTSWLSQDWEYELISGFEGRIKNLWTGKYLTVINTSDYAAVKAQPLNAGWDSQIWITEYPDEGGLRLKNKWSGRYLTVASTQENAAVVCQPLNTGWASQIWNTK